RPARQPGPARHPGRTAADGREGRDGDRAVAAAGRRAVTPHHVRRAPRRLSAAHPRQGDVRRRQLAALPDAGVREAAGAGRVRPGEAHRAPEPVLYGRGRAARRRSGSREGGARGAGRAGEGRGDHAGRARSGKAAVRARLHSRTRDRPPEGTPSRTRGSDSRRHHDGRWRVRPVPERQARGRAARGADRPHRDPTDAADAPAARLAACGRRSAAMSRRLVVRIAATAGAIAVALATLLGQVSWPSSSPPPPLPARPFDFPSYELRTLPNGLQVLFVPQHEQPSVSFRMIVRAGTMQEPEDKPGVASFVAALLNQGTMHRTASEIADTIDSAGGLLGVGSGAEVTFVQGAVVKDRTDLALDLMAEIVRSPSCPEQEVTFAKQQALAALQVGYDDPDYLASAAFARLVFGLHPYGRPGQGTPESIPRITRDDLVEFHRTWFVPNNAIMAVVGDLTAAEAFAAVERAFGDWERRDVPQIVIPAPPPPRRRIVVLDRPGSAQTEIRAGHLAIERTHPDYIALDLAVRILGGE